MRPLSLVVLAVSGSLLLSSSASAGGNGDPVAAARGERSSLVTLEQSNQDCPYSEPTYVSRRGMVYAYCTSQDGTLQFAYKETRDQFNHVPDLTGFYELMGGFVLLLLVGYVVIVVACRLDPRCRIVK